VFAAIVGFANLGHVLADETVKAGANDTNQAAKSLEAIGKAVSEYQKFHRCFPSPTGADSEGKSLLSWRVHILRFLGDEKSIELSEKFKLNEPWDSEHNQQLIKEMPEIYKAPGSKADLEFKTPFLATRSNQSLFGNGPYKRRWKDMVDGTMRTIMVVQVAEENAVPWTKPDDYQIDEQNPFAGLARSVDGGYTMLFGDGAVRTLPSTITADQLNAMYTCQGGENIDLKLFEKVIAPKTIAEITSKPRNPLTPGANEIPLNPAYPLARGAGDNLYTITKALITYFDHHRSFPIATRGGKNVKGIGPALSWRVSILPYVGEPNLYQQFKLDEPWDSEHNKKLIEKMPSIYKAPSSKTAADFKTVYLTPRGDNTAFPADRGLKHASIIDGTSKTIFVVEASDESAVIWTKPDDYEVDENSSMNGLVGLHQGGFLAAFGDNCVRFIPKETDSGMLKAMFTRNDGKQVEKPPLVIWGSGERADSKSYHENTPAFEPRATKTLTPRTFEEQNNVPSAPPPRDYPPQPSGGAGPQFPSSK
jgi:hypothetical protein